jgi:hypothetical protein
VDQRVEVLSGSVDAVRARGEDATAQQRTMAEDFAKAEAELRASVSGQISALRQQLQKEAAEWRSAEADALNGQGGAAWRTTVLDEKLAGVGRALGERLAACEAQLAGEERDRRAAVDDAVSGARRQWTSERAAHDAEAEAAAEAMRSFRAEVKKINNNNNNNNHAILKMFEKKIVQ